MLQPADHYFDSRNGSQYDFRELREDEHGRGDVLLDARDLDRWSDDEPTVVIGLGEFLRYFKPFHANFGCGHCGRLEWRPIHQFSSGHTTVIAGGQCMWCGCALCEECPEEVGREIC